MQCCVCLLTVFFLHETERYFKKLQQANESLHAGGSDEAKHETDKNKMTLNSPEEDLS